MILMMVLSTVAPAATVLCDCEDGDTTIESVFDLCCSELNTQPSSNSTPDSESQPEDPCRDVPLTIDAEQPEKGQLLAYQCLLAPAYIGIEYPSLELLPAEAVSIIEDPPPYFSSLDVIRLQL